MQPERSPWSITVLALAAVALGGFLARAPMLARFRQHFSLAASAGPAGERLPSEAATTNAAALKPAAVPASGPGAKAWGRLKHFTAE